MISGDYLTWLVIKFDFMLAYLLFLAKLDTMWPSVGFNDMAMDKNGAHGTREPRNFRIKAFAFS